MSNPTVAGFRLSVQQDRTWSQHAGSAPFWTTCELAIAGRLDEAKLKPVIQRVVSRHEILRTVYHRQTGVKVPFQVILDSAEFVWAFLDLQGQCQAACSQQLTAKLNQLEGGFDLEKGPALQVVLAKTGASTHVMVLALPSLSADVRTLRNLIGEIGREYSGAGADEEIMQYADIAEWQQEMLASDESKAARDYWRDYGRKLDFAALGTVLSAFEKKPAGDVALDSVKSSLPSQVLGEFGGEALPSFLLTCWGALLSRIAGRQSVAVGCQFDGRNYAELASALGPFAKSLPLNVETAEGLSFRALLANVQHDVSDFRSWQDSFTWSNVGAPSDEDKPVVLPVAFEFSDAPALAAYGDITVRVMREDAVTEKNTVCLVAWRLGDHVELAFRFDAGRIDRATVERWSRSFVALMSAAAENPDVEVARLPLLDGEDRHRILVEWNQTAADYPRSKCIHELFEEQAAKTPDAPAFRYQDDCITYKGANERANRLANFLRSTGVTSDSLVGLCVERSTEMMVAVLAILKAGGAYVPLSAEHPKPRLAQQLAGATALITEAKFECLMPQFGGVVVLLDHDSAKWAQEAATNLTPVSGPDNYAYVIYTSGSTGTPKGVAVRHRNLVNYTTFIQHRLELGKESAALNFATVSTLGADLGNTCIYPSLVSGGCLHVIASDVAADSQRLREYTAKYPIDVLKIVPSHLMALLNSGGGNEVLPKRFLVTGGEALTPALLEKIEASGGSCEVFNHYGPTETTVGSLTLRLRDYDSKQSTAQTIPIGRPIANTRTYVLDANGEPVPVGVAGELYIAGDGVTAGYIGQPALTAERFVPERFGPDPNAEMYRTGDLVRYLPDGNIEFLGRADDQVKIRGFRIELGEIEAVLLKHAGVQQAAVLAIADERGEKSLAAYVVGVATADELRLYLRGQLPEYMVPSAVIPLAKMPLNANGKIDRLALPKPDDVRGVAREAVAPRTPSEEVVAAIWAEVLKRNDLGVEDNFFEIGGHSLLATQIASRLREHFGIPVAVRAVFESPSIAELARRMDTARREEQGLLPPPIKPVPRTGEMPLSYAQERLWVLDQIEPNNPLYNIPRALRLRGPLQVDALERAINEIVHRHESQRTSFTKAGDHPVQVIAPSVALSLDVQGLTSLPAEHREAEARRLAMAESVRPFDLTKAPLVRAMLVRIGPEDHVLQLTMHHIISDAWSAGIFLQELTALYESFRAGRPSPLPELKVQYADYAAQERDWLQGKVLETQLAFWRDQLKGLPSVIELPLDRPRPQARTFAGDCEMLHIPAEKLAGIKALAQDEGATLFMALMALYQAMLSKYSGDEQIVVGTDLANRTMPETERMIGFFINLLAVRLDLSGNPTFRELLARAREGLLESYAHQEVPFPKIVQEVQPERSSTHNPIVQVLFVMQNIPRAKRELAGLQVEPFDVPVTTSKFDMALFVSERPDGLMGYWVYSTELFDRATIQRMLGHYANLLDGAVANPDTRLASLTMLSAEEVAHQEAAKKQRKQSQLGKLKATAPSAVGLADKPDSQQ